MERETGGLSAAELADLAGVTKAEVDRLVGLGILVAWGRSGGGLQGDLVAERLELADVVAFATLGVDAGVVEARTKIGRSTLRGTSHPELRLGALLQLTGPGDAGGQA